LVLLINVYTLFSTKLEIRQNSFCLEARGLGEWKGVGRKVVGEEGNNDPNIVCTYE
jgi:hypothetical protein